jgi:uncharacterized membrane protein
MTRRALKRPASGFGLRISALGILLLALALQPNSLLACAACYGQSDSPMAKGMNAGIASLLVVVGVVLAGFAAFFVFLARRSATISAHAAAGPLLAPMTAVRPYRPNAPVLTASFTQRWNDVSQAQRLPVPPSSPRDL